MTRSEETLDLGLRTRLPTRLDNGSPEADPGPETAEVLARIARLPPAAPFTLSGGEPTLRPDLLTLLRAAAGRPVTLHTDGLALTKPGAVDALARAGLRRVRVDLHAYAPDSGFTAHNWLVRTPGAGQRAAEALRVCRAAGLETEAELVLTRPTTPMLRSTVEALYTLGVGAVRVRRLRARGAAAADFVALSPRLALLEAEIQGALALAARFRRALFVQGFPACAAPGAPLLPDPAAQTLPGCARCAGGCQGAPADYVARFGWSEIRSEDHPPAAIPPDPAPRGDRSPSTRLRRASAADTPAAPAALRVLAPAGEPTRSIRKRLALAAEAGAAELVFCGVTAHPEAVELLRDAARLPFATLTATGPAHALPPGLNRVRRWGRFRVPLYGPDAARHDAVAGPGHFAATMAGIARLAADTPARVELVGVLRGAAELPDWDAALPVHAFTLGPQGALDGFAAVLPGLSAATREAVLDALPACAGGRLAAPPPVCDPSRLAVAEPDGVYPTLVPCPACAAHPAGWSPG